LVQQLCSSVFILGHTAYKLLFKYNKRRIRRDLLEYSCRIWVTERYRTHNAIAMASSSPFVLCMCE